MPSGIDHVILTRFNLPTPGVESLVRAQEGWLRNRVVLFERYCVPSVLAQSQRRFHWIIYFDPESPGWLKEKVAEYEAAGTFSPIFRTSVSHDELIADLRSVTGAAGDELITTNLDNDDGLSSDFVDRVQSADTPRPRSAVYLSRGLIKSPDGLFLRTDRHNAFCSVRETWDDPQTCWVDWHDLLPRHMPVLEIAGSPGWLQVVHGGNVSNRIRGALASPITYRAGFSGLIDDVHVPTRHQLLRDALVSQPARALRETARSAAKRGARAVLGKDGLDRLKSLLAGMRGGRGKNP